MKIKTLLRTLDLLNAEEIVDFNLADVYLNGIRLFPMGTTKRRDMPQLRGFPLKGSVAQIHMKHDPKGKVNVHQEFIEYVKRVKGVKTVRGAYPAKSLRGSQSELVASKVAKHVHKMLHEENSKKATQLYYTDANGTLIDGHHGWATVRVYEEATDTRVDLQCIQIMAHVDQILDWAREYTAAVGIDTKEGV